MDRAGKARLTAKLETEGRHVQARNKVQFFNNEVTDCGNSMPGDRMDLSSLEALKSNLAIFSEVLKRSYGFEL